MMNAMANPKLRFRFREPTIDTNLPFTDGTVKVEGFDFETVTEGGADAWDEGFGALVRSKAANAPVISIPAFPNRKFRLSYIQVNSASGIASARDLEGKRVGIQAWSNTAGVWARGALQNYYGVNLATIKWTSANIDVPTLPEGIHLEPLPQRGVPTDDLLDAMLLGGELDAVIGPNVLPSISRQDSRVRRLFRDYKAEEQAYYRETRIFPISHVVTLTREFVSRHPEAPVALLKAYRQARDVAFDRIEGSDPVILTISWASAAMAEQRALMGDNYWAYNVEDNRVSLEAMMHFAHQQGLTPSKFDYESFFVPEAANLPGF
jgi:4,5-dihydroxyphthalate decarboxylase